MQRLRAWGEWALPGMLPALTCLLIAWIGNDRTSLWDRDEPRYAGVAQQMLETGDFIVPYFNGELRYQKPVLTYWLVAFAHWTLGDGAFASRFFSGLAAAGACFLTFVLGRSMFGRPAGIIAAWMFALCPVVFLLSKLCIPDGPLLFLSTGCFAALYATHPSSGATTEMSSRAAFGFWLALGLSLLVKGPVTLGMVFATLVVLRLLAGVRLCDFRLRWMVGLGVMLVVALPWFLAIRYTAGDGFYAESVGNQLVGRVWQSFDRKFLPPGYYAVTLLVGFAPWLMLTLLSAWRLRGEIRQGGPVSFLFAWILGSMILLEFFRSKQVHYFAPAYPALALIGSGYLARVVRRERVWIDDTLAVWSVRLTVMTVGVLAMLLVAIAFARPSSGTPAALIAALVGMVGVGVGARYWYRHQFPQGVYALAASLAVAYLLVAGFLLPGFESSRVLRPIAEEIAAVHESTGEAVVVHQLVEPSLTYYSGLAIPGYVPRENLKRTLERTEQSILLPVREDGFELLSEQYPGQVDVLRTWEGLVKMQHRTVRLVRFRPNAVIANAEEDATRR
ncbi:ArnT family glycosyltransferase [Kolteria novifilia]